MKLMTNLKPCHDCGALPGHLHTIGCDVERCPMCGCQRIGCTCRTNAPRIAWTGIWPGVEECRRFGWYAKMTETGWEPCAAADAGATEDLNRLHGGEAQWDVAAQQWTRR